jgi:hypothetical protein
MRQRYELSKQLQDLYVGVALFSETLWNIMRDPLFQITTFIEPNATRAEQAELPLRLEEAFPIAMWTYHPLFQ